VPVEPERAEEFRAASEARRAAWAWRRYVTAARTAQDRTHELRYEELVKNPESAAETLAGFLDLKPEPLAESFSKAFDRSVGRWQRELSPEQIEDVDDEAGDLLKELGYLD